MPRFLISHLAKAALVLTRLIARASDPRLLGESEQQHLPSI